MSSSRWARVAEVEPDSGSGPPLVLHPDWAERFPWLVQGTTRAGPNDFDLRIFGEGVDSGRASERLSSLAAQLGFDSVVYARQLHGAEILTHRRATGGGSDVRATGFFGSPVGDPAPGVDGHLTAVRGLLLAVTVADCVPVSLVDPRRRAVGLIHAGWRSAAAGILERGLERLTGEYGVPPDELYLHLGPSICGECYEVGTEVFAALDRPEPPGPTPIDLRGVLAERASVAGVKDEHITISAHCTLHGGSNFYSHRGGDRGRQVGLLGIREDA